MINNNKKGLSAIVTTLIIILLVLVAVGIVWAVVKNVIGTGSETIDISAKCLTIDVRATKVTCAVGGTTCDVTVERTGTATDAIAGIKCIFKDAAGATSSSPGEGRGTLAPLTSNKYLAIPYGLTTTPTEVDVYVFFEDASGVDKICTQPTHYKFV